MYADGRHVCVGDSYGSSNNNNDNSYNSGNNNSGNSGDSYGSSNSDSYGSSNNNSGDNNRGSGAAHSITRYMLLWIDACMPPYRQ